MITAARARALEGIRMPDVVLVTGRKMREPDRESHLLTAALLELGIGVEMQPWGDGFDWGSARLVVVRTPWDYSDHHEEFIRWAQQVARLTSLANPIEVLEWNSHKEYLLDLQRVGVPTIATTVVQRGTAAESQASVLRGHAGEIVIKPAISGGARGALRATADSEEAALHLAALLDRGDVLVQPLADAAMRDGEVSLIYFAGVFSHAVRKIPALGDYRVQTAHGGTVVSHKPTAAELEAGSAALGATPKPTAYGRVDLVQVAGQPTLMELEVIEPELFLGRDPQAAQRFTVHLASLLEAAMGER
jgi:glutathione synthase/RimK-type ligase-like ATP-grasp enzyme